MKYLIGYAALFLIHTQFARLQGMESGDGVAFQSCNRGAIEEQEQVARTKLILKHSPLHRVFACQKAQKERLPCGLIRHRRYREPVIVLKSRAPRDSHDCKGSCVSKSQETVVKRDKPDIDDL